MPRKSIHVGNQLRLARSSGGTAHAAGKGDGLAGYFAMKGAEDELGGVEGVEGVEACWDGCEIFGARGKKELFGKWRWDDIPAQFTLLLGDGREW